MMRHACDTRRSWIGAVMIAGALLSIAGCAASPSGIDLSIAGRANAEPSVAAHYRFMVVTWAAAGGTATDVFAAVSRDAGQSFDAPVQVNDAASEANVSGEQPPRAVIIPQSGRDPAIVIALTAHGAAGTRILS
ncbi:MAG: hypothetical protein ACRD1V_06890, partial [Vicinamibacterales bacterium]